MPVQSVSKLFIWWTCYFFEEVFHSFFYKCIVFFLKLIVFVVSYRIDGFITTSLLYRAKDLELGVRTELFSTNNFDARLNAVALMASYTFLPANARRWWIGKSILAKSVVFIFSECFYKRNIVFQMLYNILDGFWKGINQVLF